MILIVGHSGFVGRNLLSQFPNSYCLNSKGLFKKGKKIHKKNLKEIFLKKKISCIIYCAVSYENDNEKKLNYVNIILPRYFLRISKKLNIKFITFGSFYEKKLSNYKSNYTSSKIKFKKYFDYLSYEKSFYLRLEHIYGKYDSLQKFIPSIINFIKKDKYINLTNPNCVRDFTPIELVNIAVKDIFEGKIHERVFEIGTKQGQTILDFVLKLSQFYDPKNFDLIKNRIRIAKEENKDIINFSIASDVPKRILLSSKKLKEMEQLTFKKLFND